MVQLTIRRCLCGCGEFVPDGRSDKDFCNRACRARYRRYRKHLPRYTHEITHRLTLMEKYLRDPNMCELAVAEFKAIKVAIDILFDNNNIRRVK